MATQKSAAKEAEKAAKAKAKADAKAAKLAEKEAAKVAKAAEQEESKLSEGKGDYSFKIALNDSVFEFETDDIAKALIVFYRELNQPVFKTKVVIDVKYEDRTAQFVLMIVKAKHIFRQELAAVFFEKRVKMALNGK